MARFCFNTFNRSAYFGVEPDLPRQIAAAADAGFPLFGPDLFSLDAWNGSGHDLEELVALLNACGLECWELAAGLYVGSVAETLKMARHAADLAANLRRDEPSGYPC